MRLKKDIICIELPKKNKILLWDKVTDRRFFLPITYTELVKDLCSYQGTKNSYSLNEQKILNDMKKQSLLSNDIKHARYRKQMDKNNIDVIQLELTKHCNFRCKHCYLGNKIVEEEVMSLDNVKKVIREASEMGVISFDITGGEPMIRRELMDILKYISEYGMATTLYTNGSLIDEQWIDFFKMIHLKEVKISIDSIDEKIHRKIRGKAGIIHILHNIDQLILNNINVAITTVIMNDNKCEIEKTLDYFKDTKVTHSIDTYIPSSIEKISSDREVISTREFAEILCNRLRQSANKKLMHKKEFCRFAKSYLFIDARGNIKLCPNMPSILDQGNILCDSIEDIWKKMNKKYREVQCKDMNKCKYYKYCAGGCRNRALIFGGMLDSRDPYMCEFYSKYEKINIYEKTNS